MAILHNSIAFREVIEHGRNRKVGTHILSTLAMRLAQNGPFDDSEEMCLAKNLTALVVAPPFLPKAYVGLLPNLLC